MPKRNTLKSYKSSAKAHSLTKMNNLEKSYAAFLDVLYKSGEITYYEFEPIKLRLADKTFYTPDFLVISNDGLIELHETKGFWRDDARVKIKVAAEQHFYIKFIAIQLNNKNWVREEF